MPDSKSLVDALQLAPLERHALLGSRNSRRKAFAAYVAMREKIGTDFLPLITSVQPFINDHTRHHLERVLGHIEALLVRNFPKPSSRFEDVPMDRLLTWADTLILLNALVWHDIGNLRGREGHADNIKEFFSKISGMIYDTHLSDYISQVAAAHSGADAIATKIPDSHAATSYQGDDVHLQFLAAVLRFADELDEDNRRCSPSDWGDFGVVPEISRRYWFFSRVNSSIQLRVVTGEHSAHFQVDVSSHIPRSKHNLKFAADGKSTRALAEYFRRIFKIDRERQYCNKYLRSAYYHPGVNKIAVSIRTHEFDAAPNSSAVVTFELSDSMTPKDLLSDPPLPEYRKYIREALE